MNCIFGAKITSAVGRIRPVLYKQLTALRAITTLVALATVTILTTLAASARGTALNLKFLKNFVETSPPIFFKHRFFEAGM